MITLDLQKNEAGSAHWALLCLANGDQFDCYGETIADVKADAIALADSLGVTIDTFNLEQPE